MVKPQPRTPKETHTLRLRTEQEKRNEKKKKVGLTYRWLLQKVIRRFVESDSEKKYFGAWLGPTKFKINLIFVLIFFGEGNGTPLQYSCLENPMDGGAW